MDLRGFLIRCHRLQRNYSQEGLCHGICAVSYLSKLEQGKVQAADEIYQALFHRLGIAFQEQPEWLTVWKEKLQELAAAWFYEEQSEAFELEEQMERLLNSPLCVDALLIKALYEKEQAETTLASASVFLPYMQDEQRFLYHFLCARQAFQAKEAHALSEILAQLQEAQKYGGWSILYQEKGYVYARMGDYSQALHHHLKAYDLACEEGFLPCMIDASMHVANCYSGMHAEGVMLMYYERCEHLCRSSKNKQMQAHVWYNIGSTYQQWGEDQKALPLLLKAYQILDDTFLCCHKLALLYERLDQKKEGLRYVQEMERQLDSHENDGRREIVQFVKYRYGTAVDAKVYIDCLYKLCDSSLYFHGFRQFHLSYLITALKKSRRYKEVMQLMEETEFS
jgi:HTH-type transcriptional regulator, quorum sensing regulator NprR